MTNTSLEVIGYVRCDYKEKFGIPRQSGLTGRAAAFIEILPPYNQAEAFRGLDGFSHIWLLWDFSRAHKNGFTATVKPPKLGGNQRMGVFATRSPFRPNPGGLSCVKLEKIDMESKEAPVLIVSGADLMDGTPIYDIKPYLPVADCHPEALGGFATKVEQHFLQVEIPEEWKARILEDKLSALEGVLREDPRPAYQKDPERIYGMPFAGMDVRFQVKNGILTVCEITEYKKSDKI